MSLYSVHGFSLGEPMFSEKAEVAPRYWELWLTARVDIPFSSSWSPLEKQSKQSLRKAINQSATFVTAL